MLSIHRHIGQRFLPQGPQCLHNPLHSPLRLDVQSNYISIQRRAKSTQNHKDYRKSRTGQGTPGNTEKVPHTITNPPSPALDLPRLDIKWRKYWLERHAPKIPKRQDPSLTEDERAIAMKNYLKRQADKQRRREKLEREGQVVKHEIPEKKEKKYILPMFPYPSGDLHLGHLRVYTISDVLARFHRMKGYDVMHPIGWDAFGLPAENAAIDRGIDPASWTKQNIKKMKGQLETMNGQWNWDREFATCDPDFYKHTQRLFILLHERGLAYQAKSLVNYDPIDKTVLANEQVDSNGHSWRSGAKVEKRELKQWFLKISEYRQELLDDLEFLAKDGAWPERVLAMQKNWLGKSQGARIKFPVTAFNQQTHADIEVFTTRPDTLFGVQYIALASTHLMVKELAKADVELQAFLDTIPALPPDSKVGYLLPNVQATNPLAFEVDTPEAIKASLPIFIAPYVLGDYGDGAVMGVPGHDIRDHGFWKHNRYDEPIRTVVSSSPDESTVVGNKPFAHQGHLTSHSGIYAGQTSANATSMILKVLESKGLGTAAETWRLRDWLISRQRYWGTPIPIIHCDDCGPVPVPKDQLPVRLPPSLDLSKAKRGNPLEQDQNSDWRKTPCPNCGKEARRDTDTMDTFVDSSWYFMRFPDAKNEERPFSVIAAEESLPVDIYIGGVEHAILHLLYARFISKFMASTGNWPAGSKHRGEPFKRVLTQGMVHGKTYSDPATGRFLKPDEVTVTNSKAVITATGVDPNVSYEKMSKSKYNGVDPTVCISKYGADATRAHILFQAPVSEVLEWDEAKISGVVRWLKRIHEFIHQRPLKDGYVKKDGRWHFQKLRRFHPKFYFEERPDGQPMYFDLGASGYSDNHRARREAYFRTISADVKPEIEHTEEENRNLWRTVQKTIINVTASYNNGYSLNTVVSDLMTLTNAILDTSKPRFTPFEYVATVTLLKMVAPIAPAFAEECWDHLASASGLEPNGTKIYPDPRVESIHEATFPEPDGTYELLRPRRNPCSVQVNGKMKFVVMLGVPDEGLAGEELEKWVVERVLGSEEGRERLIGGEGKGAVDVRGARKVVVVQKGKGVNFVL